MIRVVSQIIFWARSRWLMAAFLAMASVLALLPAAINAEEDKLDMVTELLKDCELNTVRSAMEGILVVSWREGSKICESAVISLGRPIPQNVFRTLLQADALLQMKGAGDIEKIAYQLTEIVDARGITDPQRMKDTLDIAFKAYVGSNGRVTPKDLNIAIRQSSHSHTLTDESLYTIAAIISVRKRNNGE